MERAKPSLVEPELVLNGKANRKAVLHLLGGNLDIEWNEKNDRVYMTGEAVTVFEGEWNNNI